MESTAATFTPPVPYFGLEPSDTDLLIDEVLNNGSICLSLFLAALGIVVYVRPQLVSCLCTCFQVLWGSGFSLAYAALFYVFTEKQRYDLFRINRLGRAVRAGGMSCRLE